MKSETTQAIILGLGIIGGLWLLFTGHEFIAACLEALCIKWLYDIRSDEVGEQ